MSRPYIPHGTRDFGPDEMMKRKYIFSIIEDIFRLFGYQPLETPSMEYLSTLLGKYGDEGDRLLFKILNSGDFLSGITPEDARTSSQKLAPMIAEKGLRYDLTVPFARYIVMHQHEINFPFKRYQLQPVWRADRPQKGRYREFYQCDVDVIGSDSLLNELELIQIIDQVFNKLNIKIDIHLNNRKILKALSAYIGEAEKLTDITVAIDKLDKTGLDKVMEELADRGVSENAIKKLQPFLILEGDNEKKLGELSALLNDIPEGKYGINEMRTILDYLKVSSVKSPVKFDLMLARGLNYYTGAIIEVKAADVRIGSICGGGRYDDLTGIFGVQGISGVGVSFGADRIYDVMSELDLFPQVLTGNTQVLFLNFGEKEEKFCIPLIEKMRAAGINAELYPDRAKLKKQMAYADRKKIKYVVLIGETEMAESQYTVKDMSTGQQLKMSDNELLLLGQ